MIYNLAGAICDRLVVGGSATVAIQVSCRCGKTFPMPDFSAGEVVKCRSCSQDVTVPERDGTISLVTETIQAKCKCGARIKMSPSMAGKTTSCAMCGASVALPASPGAPPVATAVAVASPPPRAPRFEAAPKPPLRDEPTEAPPSPPPGEDFPDGHECARCKRKFDPTKTECTFCGMPKGTLQKEGALFSDCFLAFAWAFRGIFPLTGITILVVLMALGFQFIAGFLLGSGGPAVILAVDFLIIAWYQGFLTAYFLQIIKGGAVRMDAFPERPSLFAFDTTILPFLQVIGWSLFSFSPAILVWVLGILAASPLALAAIPLAFVCWPLYSLGYLGLALHERLFALSPAGMVRSILRAPGQIGFVLLMLVFAFGCAVGVFVALTFIVVVVAAASKGACGVLLALLFGLAIALPTFCYFQCVFARILGLLAYHHGDQLELVRAARVQE